ncbi:MAG TPA: 2-dehydropantoate 2-reductase N-terminal domain-containing protein [Mycobacteriales bacterium]|jgi:2-dehydropantoate 2-reductase|nr:2-dehydropantoate 2-reductase N-terminal domain-containing protein [Mycobacteriales bacterium]
MRYVVVGAGAIGGAIGGELARHGREVLLVARGAHLAELQADGLRLLTPDGAETVPAPAAAIEGVTLRPDDVLLLAVKTQDTAAALAGLVRRPVTDGSSASLLPVVCAQNGVESERLALRLFRQVYGMYVRVPATHLQPGVVVAEGTPLRGILDIGRFPAGTDGCAEQVARDLSASGFGSIARPDVMAWKYHKLLGNLGNAIDAVLGLAGNEDLVEAVRAEGRACLRAAGITVPADDDVEARAGDQVRVGQIDGHQRVGSSSRQSLLRGTGSIEADYLNGEIALLGRTYGIPTPVNEALQLWANRLAADGGAPGSVPRATFAASVARFEQGDNA